MHGFTKGLLQRYAELRLSTAIPMALIMGVAGLAAGGGAILTTTPAAAQSGEPNPCAAANPCAASNPCAATAGPCSANPCAAKTDGAETECEMPDANSCAASANPCAVDKPDGAGTPCAAANPCAAENPSAAENACAADKPCSAADVREEVSDVEALKLYECLTEIMKEQAAALAAGQEISGPSWLLSDRMEVQAFLTWDAFSTAPYISSTHGDRYVMNLANDTAAPIYRQFEAGGMMPAGGILAKPSFTVSRDGQALLGPLFLMEKSSTGSFPGSGDWIYTAVLPDGSLMGRTGAQNGEAMQFCADCHMGIGADTDNMTYLPEAYRISN